MARRGNLRSRAPRRRMFWARMLNYREFSADVATEADRFNTLALFESEYGADLFGFTITRIRGNIRVGLDSTTAVERREFSFGLRIASENHPATNASQLPSSTSAQHEDWMYALTDPLQLTDTTDWKEYHYPLDIKGQRRLDELSQSLFCYVGYTSATNTAVPSGVAQVGIELHVLCKRP